MQKALRGIFQYLVRMSKEDSHLEVERKFRIAPTEVAGIRTRLSALLFEHCGDATMQDTFLPTSIKGEMMRVRRETLNGDTTVLLTYKTWVATRDGGKERQEAERETRPLLASLLLLLGRLCHGGQLQRFSKVRSLYRGTHGPGEVVVSIDDVSGLGSYSGYYLEIEIIVPSVESDPGAAKSAVCEVARQVFGEAREDVRQSYLDMLNASRAQDEKVA
jgi:predicted adenylyl cyclase CyaB